jgi:hypothetical protein
MEADAGKGSSARLNRRRGHRNLRAPFDRFRDYFLALRFAATMAETGVGRQFGAASTEVRHDQVARKGT